MIRASLISLRIHNDTLDMFEEMIISSENPNGRYSSTSECLRELAKIGFKLLKFQKDMKDPSKAKEFQKKMEEITQQDNVFEWSKDLSDSQIDGFLTALQMEKDGRYENK